LIGNPGVGEPRRIVRRIGVVECWGENCALAWIALRNHGAQQANDSPEIKGPPLAPLDGHFLRAINANPGIAGRAA
jgi:hypothetical protein